MIRKILTVFVQFSFFLNCVLIPFEPQAGQNTQDISRLRIPRNIGRLSAGISKEKGRPDIILIEDIHGHAQAQKNIARILNLIARTQTEPLHIFLEGGHGPVDLTPIRLFPSASAVKNVTDQYLTEGRLSADEYFAIHTSQAAILEGVENEDIYKENVEAFKSFKKSEPDLRRKINSIENHIQKITPAFLSIPLQEIVQKEILYENNELPINIYGDFLMQKAGEKKIALSPFPNIMRMRQSAQFEKTDSFKNISAIIANCIRALSESASKEEAVLLIKLGLRARIEQMYTSSAIHKLIRLGLKHNIPSKDLEMLSLYAEYLKINEQINTSKLFEETENLSRQMKTAYCTTPEESSFLELLSLFSILKKIIFLKASPKDFSIYSEERSKNTDWLKNLSKTICEKNVPFLSNPDSCEILGDREIQPTINYYDTAFRRNEVLAENTISQKKGNGGPGVLILGGFHTQAVSDLFQKKGEKTWRLTPYFQSAYDSTIYEKLLLENPSSRFTPSINTLRQRPITERASDFYQLQFDILAAAIQDFDNLKSVKQFLEAATEHAKKRMTESPELLDELIIVESQPHYLLLQASGYLLLIAPANLTAPVKPDEILKETQAGSWSIQTLKNIPEIAARLKESVFPEKKLMFQLQGDSLPEEAKRFLNESSFLKKRFEEMKGRPPILKIHLEADRENKKKVYKIEAYSEEGEKLDAFALKIYDKTFLNQNENAVRESWEKWKRIGAEDTGRKLIARILDDSPETGLLLQEWIDGDKTSYSPAVLNKIVEQIVRFYLTSREKLLPGDFDSSNMVGGVFIDEEDILDHPTPFDLVSKFFMLPFSLKEAPDAINLAENHEIILKAVLSAFEREASLKEGVEFLQGAYDEKYVEKKPGNTASEEIIAKILLSNYLRQNPSNPTKRMSYSDIERAILKITRSGPDTDYNQELIEKRPLKPDQTILHLGVFPAPALAAAEALMGLRVLGVDTDPRMVYSANQKIHDVFAGKTFVEPPRFFAYNPESLDEEHGFPSDSVDHVNLAELFEGPRSNQFEKIIQNIARLLKEGGTVLLSDAPANNFLRAPTLLDVLKNFSAGSEEWNLEWDFQPLSLQYHSGQNLYLATLKKKEKKPLWVQLERFFGALWYSLERYSNVHRGMGQHSQISTRLFDRAREYIGEGLGMNPETQQVIVGGQTYRMAKGLAHNLRLASSDTVLSDNISNWDHVQSVGLPLTPEGLLNMTELENFMSRYHPKIISIQNPVQYDLNPENIYNLSALVHRFGAKLLIDASEWDADKINAKRQGIDFLLFEGGNISPFAPAILIADLEWMKTDEKEAPYEVGGGTKKLIRPGNIIWAGAPDKFEVGSPNIPGTILLGSLFKNNGEFPPNQMPSFQEDPGDMNFEKLRALLVGKNVQVPTRSGLKEYINFDNAASTPTFLPVLKALFDYLASDAKAQRILLNEAIHNLLKYFGAPAADYDLFSFRNTSEAINYLAHELNFDEGSVVINSLIEHNSNELPWRKQNNIRLPIDDHGFIDLNALEQLLAEYNEAGAHPGQEIQLVAISGASNVLGTVNDLERISEIVHQYGAQLLVDAAQLSAHRAVDMEALGIDFLVYAGHKIYAPFGHGGLIARKGYLEPPGDEVPTSPEGIIALAKMTEILQEIGLQEVAHHEEELLKHALNKFKELEKISGVKVKIHGISDPDSARLKNKTGVISFNLKISDEYLPDGLKGQDYLPFNLVAAVLAEEGGIGVRTGCFCADLLLQRLLGMSDEEAALLEESLRAGDRSNIPGTTRMSFGIYNTPEEINKLFNVLTKLAKGEYDLSKYLLNAGSGEYYTPEHLHQMEKFSEEISEKVFGPEKHEETVSADALAQQEFFDKIRNAFGKIFGQNKSWDKYFSSIGNDELNHELRKLREKYEHTKTRLSELPFLFALWVLKDMPPSSGKQHIVIMQRGADSLGILLKQTAQALGWTHIEFHDFYFNDKISGFNLDDLAARRFDEEELRGNNTQDEIFQYAAQQGFLDGSPVTLIDTGFAGSYPTYLRKLMKNRDLWKRNGLSFQGIQIASKLFFFYPPAQVRKKTVLRLHAGQIEGFNDVHPSNEHPEFWDEITRFLDKGFRHPFNRPSKLISRQTPEGERLEPEMVPEEILTQITYAAQVQAVEDMIREKMAEDRNLFPLASAPKILENVPDSQTFIYSGKSINGVATQKLPVNKKIAVFENTRGDAKAYAGNFLEALRKANSTRHLVLENTDRDGMRKFLAKVKPDFILLPQNRTDLEEVIQEYTDQNGHSVTTLAYVSLDAPPFQNLFYRFSSRIAGIVKKAIQAHQSQVSRTAYDNIFYSSSLAAGEKAALRDSENAKDGKTHAQAFRVGFIENGVISTTSNLERYSLTPDSNAENLTLDKDIPMLVISPHSDDLEIAAGGLVRSVLESKEAGQTAAYNWIIGTGDEWGVQFEPDDPRSKLPEAEQDAIKRGIRRSEAVQASAVLSEGTPGKLEVELFGLLSAAQHPLKPQAVLALTDVQVVKDIAFLETKLEGIYAGYKNHFDEQGRLSVVLPHPEDDHPHHQMSTKIILEALKNFSKKHGLNIQLLFYSSPWSGRFNTYYVSKDNTRIFSAGTARKIAIAARVKEGLGIILGELFAGFGQKPLSQEKLGGKYAERFMRKTFAPSVTKPLEIPILKPASPADIRHIFEAAA